MTGYDGMIGHYNQSVKERGAVGITPGAGECKRTARKKKSREWDATTKNGYIWEWEIYCELNSVFIKSTMFPRKILDSARPPEEKYIPVY